MPGNLPPALDAEPDDGRGAQTILDGMQVWLQAVEYALKHRPIIFAAGGFWNAKLGGGARFSDYVLWVAHYTTRPPPRLPVGFDHHLIWQFTEKGRVPGITGNIDLNCFNGSEADLGTIAIA